MRDLLQRWRRRLTVSGKFAAQEITALVTDFQLLIGHSDFGVIFRQQCINGFQMLVRADEDVGRQIFFTKSYEEDESAHVYESIGEADICVDVGANVGYWTLFMASLAKRGAVHSFEPVRLNCHLLAINVLLNGFQNVTVNQYAIGDSEVEADFVVAADTAYSSLIDTGRKPILVRTPVRVTTLDHYCRQRGIDRIDFLKIDVEGAEERVIQGAAELLSNRNRRPRLILMELYEPVLRKYGSAVDRILERMQGYCYRPFICHKGRTIPFTIEHFNYFYNVFFSQNSSD